jgi:hypothetical protein
MSLLVPDQAKKKERVHCREQDQSGKILDAKLNGNTIRLPLQPWDMINLKVNT